MLKFAALAVARYEPRRARREREHTRSSTPIRPAVSKASAVTGTSSCGAGPAEPNDRPSPARKSRRNTLLHAVIVRWIRPGLAASGPTSGPRRYLAPSLGLVVPSG